eukprot:1597455-Rhodomonas_salina.1
MASRRRSACSTPRASHLSLTPQGSGTPRNHRQETTFQVQIVLKMRFLVFDFALYYWQGVKER